MRIGSSNGYNSNGTICLGGNLAKDKVVSECEEWIASGERGAKGGRGGDVADDEYILPWLQSMNSSKVGPQVSSSHLPN